MEYLEQQGKYWREASLEARESSPQLRIIARLSTDGMCERPSQSQPLTPT